MFVCVCVCVCVSYVSCACVCVCARVCRKACPADVDFVVAATDGHRASAMMYSEVHFVPTSCIAALQCRWMKEREREKDSVCFFSLSFHLINFRLLHFRAYNSCKRISLSPFTHTHTHTHTHALTRSVSQTRSAALLFREMRSLPFSSPSLSPVDCQRPFSVVLY